MLHTHTHTGSGQWDEQPLPGAEPHCTALVTHQTMFHVQRPVFCTLRGDEAEAEAEVRRRQKQVVRLLLVFQQLPCRRPLDRWLASSRIVGAALRIEGEPGPICLPLFSFFFFYPPLWLRLAAKHKLRARRCAKC